jgi:hypothetical protein
VYSTTDFSPFEIIYEFNPLTPIPLEKKMVNLNGEKKAKIVRQLHEGVQLQIKKINRLYSLNPMVYFSLFCLQISI